MKPLNERLERIEIEEPVHIPTSDGGAIAETVMVKVPAWRDPEDGEIYLDDEAQQILDRAKARHMGLLSASQIKELRENNRLTQSEIAGLFQLGQKTWTRWESGRERPSRSMNIVLRAFADGKIDVDYLKSLQGKPVATTTTETWDHKSHIWDSVRTFYSGSFVSSCFSKAIESQNTQDFDVFAQKIRSYGRTVTANWGTAFFLCRNANVPESPDQLLDLRAYGGRARVIERTPDDEEVAA